jgi:hypothetical protein
MEMASRLDDHDLYVKPHIKLMLVFIPSVVSTDLEAVRMTNYDIFDTNINTP